MENLLNFVKAEWDVISQAPFTFGVIALLMFGASYAWHRERINSLKEQKKIRDEDLAYLKDKTGSDDVRAIAQRVTAVEDELKELGETDFAKQFMDLPKLP